MKTCVKLGAFLAGGILAASSAVAETSTFRLHDHPDGTVNPPPYGLRLDGLFGSVSTFSMDEGGALAYLDVVDSGGSIVINIRGTVYGGADTGSGWASPQLYGLEYSYNVVSDAPVNGADGWTASFSGLDGGRLYDLSDGSTVADLSDFMDPAFYFLNDGWRLAGGRDSLSDAVGSNRTWVGRGWLNVDGGPHQASQDWLFTAELIPLPGSAAMAGLGGLLVMGSRRRRDV